MLRILIHALSALTLKNSTRMLNINDHQHQGSLSFVFFADLKLTYFNNNKNVPAKVYERLLNVACVRNVCYR